MGVETNWWWVRHGPTNTIRTAGWTDLPADLSDTVAIERLSSWLPDDALVISSDLQRASRTADAICGSRIRLADVRELREINFGEWDGLTADEIAARCPDLATAYWSDPFTFAPPGGETWQSVTERVVNFTNRMTSRHAGRNIVAVAHFGVILTQVQRATCVSDANILGKRIDYLSVSRTSFKGGKWTLRGFNIKP